MAVSLGLRRGAAILNRINTVGVIKKANLSKDLKESRDVAMWIAEERVFPKQREPM